MEDASQQLAQLVRAVANLKRRTDSLERAAAVLLTAARHAEAYLDDEEVGNFPTSGCPPT